MEYDRINVRKPRNKAWRNIMVSVINHALSINYLSLNKDDKTNDKPFNLVIGGHEMECRVSDIGYSEVSVTAWSQPVYATGWLERETGLWLQTGSGFKLRITGQWLPIMANITIEPNGYADNGRFFR